MAQAKVIQIACGSEHSCALLDDEKTVIGWGNNNEGQCNKPSYNNDDDNNYYYKYLKYKKKYLQLNK